MQPSSGGWANSKDSNSESHFQNNLCGKNLLVWMYSAPVSSCNENAAGVLARNLIDAAVSYGGTPTSVRDYITNSKGAVINYVIILGVGGRLADANRKLWKHNVSF